MIKRDRKNLSRLVGTALLTFTVALIVCEFIVAVINNVLADTELMAYSYTLIIIPFISIIFTGIIVWSASSTSRNTAVLIESLNRVAQGDYNAVIDPEQHGSFSEVYENFNKMTKELNSVKSMREEFVHSLSHEFKTPLCSIQGFANLLLEGEATEEESRQYLQIIADEADRLRRLADGVLTISKLETQHLMDERREFRLDEQIRDCVIMYQRFWSEKNIDVEVNLDEVTINGDADMLKHVWINLISNAVKFTPENGKIDISLKRENGGAVAVFKDSGYGVNEEDISKIFDKYYRSPSAKKTAGNGLGLAICKRICTLYDGTITCKSKKGNGAEFTVTLPL